MLPIIIRMKIASVVGARPQFIKCAPLSREIRKHHQEILIHTGQHYDYGMSEIFFEELDIPKPNYNLGIGSAMQGEQTGKMIIAIEKVLMEEAPDMVLVYGDTNSTLAAALAASKLHIKLAHVESGLRSFDRMMPEEINRVITDHVSNQLFCPTFTAIRNLENEGIVNGAFLVGDVMIDALKFNIGLARAKSRVLERFEIRPNDYIVATIHRPSNSDDMDHMQNIVQALGESGKRVILPLHPRTKNALQVHGIWREMPENVMVVDPVGYLDMIRLLSSAEKIVTDSGGIQKEAYAMRVPCITVRDSTEWTETVEDGWNILVKAKKEDLLRAIDDFQPPEEQSEPFGDGNASRKIVQIMSEGTYDLGIEEEARARAKAVGSATILRA
jgi:UDP-N-acetylglucosamine 2-epimerase (non-hydrolysing)